MFSDLFAQVGCRSVPPSVVAVVTVLQRLDGLPDREAVAAGGMPPEPALVRDGKAAREAHRKTATRSPSATGKPAR